MPIKDRLIRNGKGQKMVRVAQTELHPDTETWELQTAGTVWIWVKDPKERNGWKKQRAGGSGGSKRVHITAEERRHNEEQVVDENQATHNIFRNGALMRVDKGAPADDIDTRYHLADDDLRALIQVRDLALFSEELSSINSELIIRRLKAIADVDGTMAQVNEIDNLIEMRYKAGGTQRTVQELIDAGEKLGGEQLS